MKNAFVTSVILEDMHITSALVLAYSIRYNGSTSDLVILVTKDVSKQSRDILGAYFNHVIEIDYIKLESYSDNLNNLDPEYKTYLELALVKFKALNLIQYEKIVLLDSCCLILKNPDYIFSLKAPTEYLNYKILLLEPQEPIEKEFDKIIKYVLKESLNLKKESQSLKKYIKKYYDWNNLDQSKFEGIYFGKNKPYTNVNDNVNEITKDKYCILWHEYYSQILKQHEEFYNYEELKETNEIHKYFGNNLQRYNKKKRIQNRQKIIKKLLNLNRIKQDNISYYFTDIDREYLPKNIQIMFNNINEFDYIGPIIKLAEYYGENSYYSKILDKYEKSYGQDNTMLNIQFGKDITQEDKDLIILEYIKCRKDMLFVVVFDDTLVNQTIRSLERLAKITYIKTFMLNEDGLFNFLYYLYDEYTFQYRLDKISNLKIADRITIIFYEGNNNFQLTNRVYMSKYFYQSILIGQLILNENSLDFLNTFDIKKIIRNYKSIESHLKLQTFKKWCFLNLSLLELDRLILFSYGMKKMKDINGMFTYIGDSQSEQELYELISSNFYSKKSDFSFVDIGIENTKYWHDSWKSDIIRIYEKLKVRSSIAVCTNPKCYYYFNGLKMIKKNEKRFDNDYIFIVF